MKNQKNARPLLVFLMAITALVLQAAPAWSASSAAHWSRTELVHALRSGQALRHPRLQGARIVTDAKGEPLISVGTFNVVAQVEHPERGTLALRFSDPANLTDERQDPVEHKGRIQKLSMGFNRMRAEGIFPDELVGFDYLTDAVEVNNQLIPALEMPWVRGESLDRWVKKQLEAGRLDMLHLAAQAWREAMRAMDAADAAHGDLQHKNVRVDDEGRLRFIDPDPNYLPELAGLRSSEVGHENYTHPEYFFGGGERPFDSKMDHISGIVIYLSLLALVEDPSLWERFHYSRTILFRSDRDFVNPAGPKSLLKVLTENSKISRIRGLALALGHYAVGKAADVPNLEDAILDAKELALKM